MYLIFYSHVDKSVRKQISLQKQFVINSDQEKCHFQICINCAYIPGFLRPSHIYICSYVNSIILSCAHLSEHLYYKTEVAHSYQIKRSYCSDDFTLIRSGDWLIIACNCYYSQLYSAVIQASQLRTCNTQSQLAITLAIMLTQMFYTNKSS